MTTNIVVQKIDGFFFETYEIVTAGFSVYNKLGIAQFFEDTFLVANTSMEMILGMLFLSFSNINIQYDFRKYTRKTYMTTKTTFIVRRVELIEKYEFVKAALHENFETFEVHIVALEILSGMMIHFLPAA